MNTRNFKNSEDEFEFGSWDGVDRQNHERYMYDYLHTPPMFPYYDPSSNYAPQHKQPVAEKNIAQTTLTLQQIGGIIIVLGSVLVSGFSAWNNLNKEIDIQRNSLEQLKLQISKDISSIEKILIENKRDNTEIFARLQKNQESIDTRINEIDSTVMQIFQKINSK